MVLNLHGKQFPQSPYMVCNACLDRWRNPNALMDAALTRVTFPPVINASLGQYQKGRSAPWKSGAFSGLP
jgi:hypothetical protein